MELKLIHNGRFYKGVTKDRMGPHFPDKPYNVGTVHKAAVSTDLSQGCAPGIHVCLTIAEALRWGPVVVEVEVPDDATIVMTSKTRVGPQVKVVARDVQVGANLRGANLWGANLSGANLRDADLWGANLRGANLWGANLSGANLRDANLWGANLSGANLRGANLWGANLWGANLRDANLRDANLWDAHLRGAHLSGAHLSGAYGNTQTVLPVGYEVTSSGLIVRK